MTRPSGYSRSTSAKRRPTKIRGDDSLPAGARFMHAVLFWMLSTMAVLVFAPCVLVPLRLETDEIRAYEAEVALEVAKLEEEVARNEHEIGSMLTDPLVIDRLRRRDLNVQPQDERILRYEPAVLETAEVDLSVAVRPEVAIKLPEVSHSRRLVAIFRWLPRGPWIELFGPGPYRSVLMMMSCGLLVTAFVLFSPRPTRNAVTA